MQFAKATLAEVAGGADLEIADLEMHKFVSVDYFTISEMNKSGRRLQLKLCRILCWPIF